MTNTTGCAGCQKTIFTEKSSPIFLGANIVGHVHKVPGAVSEKVTHFCIRQAFWRLRAEHPTMIAISIDGKIYNEENTPPPNARRPSGSGASALRHAQAQKPGVGSITHTLHHPSRSF
jgi:hypothetical protein